jgi:hypothetical protein
MCPAGLGCQFVVDTGTSILVGPKNRIAPLIALANKTGTIAKDGTMDCALESTLPVLTFEIDLGVEKGAKKYTLEPSFYVLKGQTTSGMNGVAAGAIVCQLGIQALNPLLSGELWILVRLIFGFSNEYLGLSQAFLVFNPWEQRLRWHSCVQVLSSFRCVMLGGCGGALAFVLCWKMAIHGGPSTTCTQLSDHFGAPALLTSLHQTGGSISSKVLHPF